MDATGSDGQDSTSVGTNYLSTVAKAGNMRKSENFAGVLVAENATSGSRFKQSCKRHGRSYLAAYSGESCAETGQTRLGGEAAAQDYKTSEVLIEQCLSGRSMTSFATASALLNGSMRMKEVTYSRV